MCMKKLVQFVLVMTIAAAFGTFERSSAQTPSVAHQPVNSPQVQPGTVPPSGLQSPAPPAPALSPAPATPPASAQPPAQTAPANLPPIVFEPPILDFGRLKPNQGGVGSVNIKNTSDKPLKILASKASCTCTSVNLANITIPPGQSVPMPAQFKGSSYLGKKQVAVIVRIAGYDDIQVQGQAMISLPVFADPAFISAMTDPKTHIAQAQQGELTIASEDGKPFRILSVQGNPPNLVDFDPVKDSPRNSYKIKWDFSYYNSHACADEQGKPMPEFWVVETDHPDCPVFDIQIRHACTRQNLLNVGDQWIFPDKRTLLGLMKPGESKEITLEAKWLPKSNHSDPVTSLYCEIPQVSAQLLSVTSTPEGFEAHVKITAAPEMRGFLYGVLRMQSQNQAWPIMLVGSVRQ
jgi:hypothetical protein